MISRITIALLLLMVGGDIIAQPWTFSRLPIHVIDQDVYDLVATPNVGFTNGGGTVIWKGAEQNIVAWDKSRGAMAASTVDSNGTMMALMQDGSLMRVTSDGDVEVIEKFVFSVRAASICSYDVDRTLVIRPDALLKYTLVYDIENTTALSIDTINVDSVTHTQIHHNRITGAVTVTLRHTVDGRPATTSLDWDRQTRTWAPRPTTLDGTMVVFSDGDTVVFRVGDSLNHAVLVDDRVILAMWKTPGKPAALNIQRSDDRGVSFVRVPELDTLVFFTRDVQAWPDGSVLFATAIHGLVQWFPDGRIVRLSTPKVDYVAGFDRLVPVLEPERSFLGTGEIVTIDPVYDGNTDEWRELPQRIEPSDAFPWQDKVVIHSGSTAYLWDPGQATMAPARRRDISSVALPSMLDVVGISDAAALIVSNQSPWYLIDTSGYVDPLVVNLYLDTASGGSRLVDISGGAERLANGDVLVGSRSSYYLDETGAISQRAEFMGLLRTTDMGTTWSESNTGLGTNTYIYDLHRGADGLLYCIGAYGFDGSITRGSLYISRDEGITWTECPSPVPGNVGKDMEISVSDLGAITINSIGLARSTDGGASWVEIAGSWPENAQVLYAMEQPWDHRLAVSTTHGIYVSDISVDVAESETSNAHQGPNIDPCRPTSGFADVLIADVLGRVVYGARIEVNGPIEIPQAVPSGVYLRSVNDCTSTIVITR